MVSSIICLALLSIINFAHCTSETVVINTSDGALKGQILSDWKHNKYYNFKSIPYAEKPTGPNRFKEPIQIKKWSNIKEAIEESPICFQEDQLTQQAVGQEDCLYLNVYAPINLKELKPVMVYIHGGAYMDGSGRSDSLGPEYLVSKNIVLVTLNYRLGLLGQLILHSSNYSSINNGLKDQIMALKWVQRNIKHFGGNSSSVTLFGESAGASSTHLLALSPKTSNLFHRIILESGGALNYWALGPNTEPVLLDILKSNKEEALSLLQGKTLPEILELQKEILKKNNAFFLGPVIDGDLIVSNPKEIVESGNYNKISIIIGYNDNEGLFLEVFRQIQKSPIRDVNLTESILYYAKKYNIDDKGVEAIRKLFFKDSNGVKSNSKEYFRLISAFEFVFPAAQTVRAVCKTSTSPVYLYRFSFVGSLNVFRNKLLDSSVPDGASHVDELGYLFTSEDTKGLNKTEEDVQVLETMTTFWSDFAKGYFDDGTYPKWRRVDPEYLNYFKIDKESGNCNKLPEFDEIDTIEKQIQ